jgi:hypothetical protein
VAQHGEKFIFRMALAFRCLALAHLAREALVGGRELIGALAQLLGLAAQFFIFLRQRHEDLHLRAQHLRDDGCKQEVGRAPLVSLEAVDFIGQEGRHENDGDVGRAGPLVDRFGRFETIHTGHVHVEQNDGEIVQQDLAQRFLARAGRQDFVMRFHSPLVKQAGQGQQAGHIVVDDENFRFRSVRHVGSGRKCSWILELFQR